jgi:hypothetical protein
MPASVDWYPELENTLLMTVEGNISMDEVFDITHQESEFIENADHVVHTIIDLRGALSAPSGFLASLPRLRTLPAVSHPNSGSKVVVGARGFIQSMLNIFSRSYHLIHMVDTMDDAHKKIREIH